MTVGRNVLKRTSMAFLIKKCLQTLFLPPVLPLLLLALGAGLSAKRRKAGRVLVLAGLGISYVFSIPLTVSLMAKGIEIYPPVRMDRLEKAQAIVILGGGHRGRALEYGQAMPNEVTLERLSYGAVLARRTHLPVLVSGGAPEGGDPESAVMARTLDDLFGLKAAFRETRSLDTADNARYCREILEKNGIDTVVLVTHAAHMRRAVSEFRGQGFSVIPAPTVFLSHDTRKRLFFGLVPDIKSTARAHALVHEAVGLFVLWLRNLGA